VCQYLSELLGFPVRMSVGRSGPRKLQLAGQHVDRISPIGTEVYGGH